MKNLRLVAYIFPETSWGDPINEGEAPTVAREIEKGSKYYGLSLEVVGPMRSNTEQLMVYSEAAYIPDNATIEDFIAFKEMLEEAIAKPVLHKEDFSEIF